MGTAGTEPASQVILATSHSCCTQHPRINLRFIPHFDYFGKHRHQVKIDPSKDMPKPEPEPELGSVAVGFADPFGLGPFLLDTWV